MCYVLTESTEYEVRALQAGDCFAPTRQSIALAHNDEVYESQIYMLHRLHGVLGAGILNLPSNEIDEILESVSIPRLHRGRSDSDNYAKTSFYSLKSSTF